MHRRTPRRRGWANRAGSALLTVAALCGAICIVLVPLAFVLHISLIMFKTNSMSPTMPAGSLALVRSVPASQVRVGDVVTVDRSPAAPITHRVTSVAPGPNGARTITLRGDANPVDDPAPYVVTHVRRVIVAVPRLAYAVRAVSNPRVMAGITLAAALLVMWAFWPRTVARHSAAVLLLVAMTAAASIGAPRGTLASWSAAEYTNAPLAAGTVGAPTSLHCSAGLLSNVAFSWTAPAGGLTRSSYTWTLTGGLTGSGSPAAGATSVTLPSGAFNVIASGTFTLYANGPGGWVSTSVTGTVTVTGTLGVPVATSCTPP
jgi:signal peptidase I